MKLKNKITKFFNRTTPTVGLTAYSFDMAKILDKYVPEFPKEVKLQLPKLKKVGSTKPKKINLPKLKKV